MLNPIKALRSLEDKQTCPSPLPLPPSHPAFSASVVTGIKMSPVFPGEAGGQKHSLCRRWLSHSKRHLPTALPFPTPWRSSSRQQLWITLSRDGYFPQELVALPRTERTVFGQGYSPDRMGSSRNRSLWTRLPFCWLSQCLKERERYCHQSPRLGHIFARGPFRSSLATRRNLVLSTAASARAQGPLGRCGPLNTAPGTQRPLA